MEQDQSLSETENKVDPSRIPAIQGKSVDLSKHHNKSVKIELVEITQVPSKFTEKIEGTEEHYLQWVLKVSSEVLEEIGEGEDLIKFRASELFNLIQNKKGEITGFPTGESSNLMKFSKDIGIKNPHEFEILSELIVEIKDRSATVKTYEKEVEGKKKNYMKFKY